MDENKKPMDTKLNPTQPKSSSVHPSTRRQGDGLNEGSENRSLPNQRGAITQASVVDSQPTEQADIGLQRGTDISRSPLAQMHKLIERSGEEPFPDDIMRILSEPIDDSLVDIRPDGLIFVSHPHYRDRLDRAFGVGGWALIPLDKPQIKDNRVVYWGFLKARGQYIADAVGGAQYYPNNRQGSYDNSVEAAKSDCLVRCCKALPMFRECWDKEYADYWVSTYTEWVSDGSRGGQKVLKKKGAVKRNFDARPGRLSQGEYYKPPRIEDENKQHIAAIAGEGKLHAMIADEYEENPEYQWDREEAE